MLPKHHISNAVVTTPNEVTVDIICPCCAGQTALRVPLEGYTEWLQGTILIQNALPTLTPDERELLISGTCEKCFNDLFNTEDEGTEDPATYDPAEDAHIDNGKHIDGYDRDDLGESPDY